MILLLIVPCVLFAVIVVVTMFMRTRNQLRLTAPVYACLERTAMVHGPNVLVTGGLGFIGSNVVLQLLERKDSQITVFDDRLPALYERHPNITYICGDIMNVEHVHTAFLGVESVIHIGHPFDKLSFSSTEAERLLTGVKNVVHGLCMITILI